MRDNMDSPWKAIVDAMLPDCVRFSRPRLYDRIDWPKGYRALDAEMLRLEPDGKTKALRVDKIIQVRLKTGETRLLYIHIEIQSGREAHFPRRMLFYSMRILETYHSFPLSLAILIDGNPNWKPNSYKAKVDDCSIRFKFPILKLLDYAERRAELEASDNLFAAIILAQLDAMASKGKPAERLVRKTALMKKLLLKGFAPERIRDVIRFIDWLMILPPKRERAFYNEMTNLAKEKHMPFVDIFEKMGIEKGTENGMHILISDVLESKFGEKGGRLAVKLREIRNSEKLRDIFNAINRQECDLAAAKKLIAKG